MLVEHGGEHLTSVEVVREWIWQVHIYDTKLLMFFSSFFFFFFQETMKMKGLFFYYLFNRSGDGDHEWKKLN